MGVVEEAALFVRLHINGGEVDGKRLPSEESVVELRRVVPRGQTGLQPGLVPPAPVGGASSSLRRAPRRGAGFWNVVRVYLEESLGIVVMGKTTSYGHGSVCGATGNAPWE
jgi:hypothetical protein